MNGREGGKVIERLRDFVQTSFFDFVKNPEAEHKIGDCYRCLFFESHRCRNNQTCPDGMKFIRYTGSTVKQCILATIEVFQDGYIHCPVLDCYGCEKCMKETEKDGYEFVRESSQNYERTVEGL